MKIFRPIIFVAILTLALLLSACTGLVPLEEYQPLGVIALPKAEKVVICVQPFEDETKNGFTNKRWVGSRYTVFDTLDKDYELKDSTITETVTQAAALELASQGFQVIHESAPAKKFFFWKGSAPDEINQDCHYIVKGKIKKFWVKVFWEVTSEVLVEAELINADTGKTMWTKKEVRRFSQDMDDEALNSPREGLWIAENIRTSRDYVIRKLFRDEKFQVLVTRKVQ